MQTNRNWKTGEGFTNGLTQDDIMYLEWVMQGMRVYGYECGREDAAEAVRREIRKYADGLDFSDEGIAFHRALIDAARDMCYHQHTQYSREVCFCGNAVDVCDNCGADVHECTGFKSGEQS